MDFGLSPHLLEIGYRYIIVDSSLYTYTSPFMCIIKQLLLSLNFLFVKNMQSQTGCFKSFIENQATKSNVVL